jgi:hypothetical protein
MKQFPDKKYSRICRNVKLGFFLYSPGSVVSAFIPSFQIWRTEDGVTRRYTMAPERLVKEV